MAISLCLNPLAAHFHFNSNQIFPLLHTPISRSVSSPSTNPSPKPRLTAVNSVHDGGARQLPEKPPRRAWEGFLSSAASLYPVYVTAGGIVACFRPSAFSWFVKSGPASYSLTLGFIMLIMGLTLELKDLLNLFVQRPFSILFGCIAQYTIMPTFGYIISKTMGLSPSISTGLILLACCPGGTASNVVTLIAQGDVPLSVVMTVCSTLGAVILTPLLTKILAGTFVTVDAIQLSISTLQVVVAPILIGSYLQSNFQRSVKSVTPFAPLLAVLAASLLASSVFSENVVHMKSLVPGVSFLPTKAILSSDFGVVMLSVMLLHFAGFIVGYLCAVFGGFGEPQRRAISIEVGMQNSALGVVLATSHFTSRLVALPPAMSALVMNIMGSSLGFFWRSISPCSSTNASEVFQDREEDETSRQ